MKFKNPPPQSSDLNQIKNVWAKLKFMVENHHPKNLQELKSAILQIWEEKDLKFIRKFAKILENTFENSSLALNNTILKMINHEDFYVRFDRNFIKVLMIIISIHILLTLTMTIS
jgi:hypothetical protein